MIDYLLDTHVLLWSIFESNNLSKTAQDILLNKNCRKFISIIAMWEISIKNRIGKLPLPNGVSEIFDEVEKNGFSFIGVDRQCVEIYNTLPLTHRDPFDGIIIATAIIENLTIVTADENIQKYNIPWVW